MEAVGTGAGAVGENDSGTHYMPVRNGKEPTSILQTLLKSEALGGAVHSHYRLENLKI